MATAEQTEEFRVANAELVAQVEDRLDEFWSQIEGRDDAASLNALFNYLPLLTQQFGELATLIATDWFAALRFDAIDDGLIAAVGRATSWEAVRTDPVIAMISARSRDYWRYRMATDGPDAVIAGAKDTATRAVRQSGRQAVTINADRDPAARGWQRVTRPGACRFCRALSDRGGVYTRQSVRFAAHGPKCNCVAAPVWNQDAPEVETLAYVASRNTAGLTEEQRRAQRERVSAWLERKFPGESDHPTGEHTTDD